MLRLYDDVYPEYENSPFVHLANFLAVPVQFMVATVIYANYTVLSRGPLASVAEASGIFALPSNMTTVAVGGKSMQRFVGRPWAVWAFMSSSCALVLAAGALLAWMLWQPSDLPKSSGMPELDAVAM